MRGVPSSVRNSKIIGYEKKILQKIKYFNPISSMPSH